ncbi:hypothetical protein LTR28_006554 [Elasticomyces elasticus]|nr:hypothetical protein LTR28_006554 [Elasticomyces elasticus]
MHPEQILYCCPDDLYYHVSPQGEHSYCHDPRSSKSGANTANSQGGAINNFDQVLDAQQLLSFSTKNSWDPETCNPYERPAHGTPLEHPVMLGVQGQTNDVINAVLNNQSGTYQPPIPDQRSMLWQAQNEHSDMSEHWDKRRKIDSQPMTSALSRRLLSLLEPNFHCMILITRGLCSTIHRITPVVTNHDIVVGVLVPTGKCWQFVSGPRPSHYGRNVASDAECWIRSTLLTPKTAATSFPAPEPFRITSKKFTSQALANLIGKAFAVGG